MLMALRIALGKRYASFRFHWTNSEIDIGDGAQIRSFSLFPAKQSAFRLGKNSIFSGYLSLEREAARVSIGERTYVGKSLLAASRLIEIGSDVLISWNVTIVDHHSHALDFSQRSVDVLHWLSGKKDWTHVSVAPVEICDKVWIGFGAAILPGVRIGEGAIVGACSVVTHDVPPWTVVAGNPARPIKELPRAERQ